MRGVGWAFVVATGLASCAPHNDPPPQPYYYPPQPTYYPPQPQYYPQPPYYPQPAPQPQPVPAGWPQDPLVRYNVDQINAYRARAGLPVYTYDAQLTAFAYAGSQELSQDHSAHAHFQCCSQGAPGFGHARAENQGDPSGVPQTSPDPFTNGRTQIDTMLRMMMDEGPGGGHYDNMMSQRYRRVGVGLYYAGGKLYMTNDFSD
ncbi:MAG TPA: CAP domain-containing protein [Labilithrix sp.]|jgi:hypothetical protein